MEYELIRSSRKTISIEIKPGGKVVVRAPRFCPKYEIERILWDRRDWIDNKIREVNKRLDTNPVEKFTKEDIAKLKREADVELYDTILDYATRMQVHFGRITIRAQKTRWGSCNKDGNLNFNCLLMLVPREVMEYVVVHELAHIREMNHSKAFWAIVERYCPEYKKCRKWLRDEGHKLIQRLPD